MMAVNILKNVSLARLNTFGVDVNAAFFTDINHVNELKELIASEHWKIEPKLILGGGSNVLFKKDFLGLVVKINLKGITIDDREEIVYLKAMSGENWHGLVEFAIERGFAGIENLSLIPGLVGTAPIQNIGAYGVELENCFESLEAVDRSTGELVTFTKEECHFGYRDSIFKTSAKDKYIIVSVALKLSRKPVFHLDYGAIRETLQKMNPSEITINNVSKAVIHIRKSKLPDPKQIGNAGSFFKNPVIEKTQFDKLSEKYPEIPGYPAGEGKVKVPAGWLVEKSGLKGFRKGNAGIHRNQALVIVNYGGARGEEIFEISEIVQKKVSENFGIQLEREVNVIG